MLKRKIGGKRNVKKLGVTPIFEFDGFLRGALSLLSWNTALNI